MKVKAKEMVMYVNCPMSYELNKLSLVSEKNGNYFKAVAMRKIVKEFFKVSQSERTKFIADVKAQLETSIPKDALNALSRSIEIEKLSTKIENYLNWLSAEGAMWVHGSATRTLKIPGRTDLIEASCDYVLEIDGLKYVIQLKSGAPHLSHGGRSNETRTYTSFELYLLERLGEELFGEDVIGTMHHLKPRGSDKTVDFSNNKNVSGSTRPDHLSKGVLRSEIEGRMATMLDKMSVKSTACNPNNCMNCTYKSICGYKEKEKREIEVLKSLSKANEDFKLTDNQRKAVVFGDGIVRVNAGAGSGKTTIVALRVAEQVIDGINPENILLITFTNKGAGEMREKIQYWLAKEGLEEEAKKLNIETFNSWGGKVIQKHHNELGFSEMPKLLNRVEKYDIIFDLLKKYPVMDEFNYEHPILNFPHAKGVVVKMAEFIDYIKSMGVMDMPSKTPHHLAVIDIYNDFNKALKDQNYIEYQDQIRLVNEAADNDMDFMSEYNYEHIIIDEFQDTDSGQLDLILYLANQPKFKSLMIVGDDSQSIYGFRNTSQENILNFGRFFNDLKDIKLMENFRSTSEILSLANHINDLNAKKINKKLIPMESVGSPLPRYKVFNKEEEELDFIAADIDFNINVEGWMPEDIAVIARTRNELFDIQQKLDEKNIPSVIDVPEPLLKNPRLLPMKNILDFVDNPANTLGVADYLNITSEGFLDKDESDAKKEIENMKKEMDALLEGLSGEVLDAVQKSKFIELVEVIQDEELALFIEEVQKNNETFKSIKNYIDKFIAYEDGKVYSTKSEERKRAVTLITVHASKGKEYNIVYGTLKKFKEVSASELDEERRTLFVAITRAKKELILTSCKKSKHSQLLREIEESKKVKLF